MKKLLLLFLVPVLFTNCKNENSGEADPPSAEETELSVVERVAQAHGIENFKDTESIKYTFNVRRNDTVTSQRSWEWHPQEKEVRLITADSTIAYNQEEVVEEYRNTDHRFINDNYWFLFPFHLVWDEMEYEHEEQATAPISGETLQKVTVTYPADAGYTPGDVYEVYFGDDYIVREWVFRSGGREEPSLMTTWEDYETFNGMEIATMHRNPEGSFEIFFSDIEVETE